MIELERRFHDEIVRQAVGEYPNEACGLIAAKEGIPVRVYPMRNADASPVTYRFDTKEQLKVTDEIEEAGEELYAIYHSHTHSEAFPSATDIRKAHFQGEGDDELVAWFPDVRYLILSLQDRDRPVLRGFQFQHGEPVEEEVRIG